MPRLEGAEMVVAKAQNYICYDRYVVTQNTPETIKLALDGAPPGMALREEMEEDDVDDDVESYQIHDAVGFCLSVYSFLTPTFIFTR
jgi:hypothetical protein